MSSPFRLHRGHALELVTYGPAGEPENVAAECLDCNEVMVDHDLDVPSASAELLLSHEPHAVIDVTASGALRCGCGDIIADPND